MSYSSQRVAENLDVGVSTVHRIETLFDETGSIGKRKVVYNHWTGLVDWTVDWTGGLAFFVLKITIVLSTET